MNEKNVYTQYTTEKPEVFEFSHRITAVELPASLDQGLVRRTGNDGNAISIGADQGQPSIVLLALQDQDLKSCGRFSADLNSPYLATDLNDDDTDDLVFLGDNKVRAIGFDGNAIWEWPRPEIECEIIGTSQRQSREVVILGRTTNNLYGLDAAVGQPIWRGKGFTHDPRAAISTRTWNVPAADARASRQVFTTSYSFAARKSLPATASGRQKPSHAIAPLSTNLLADPRRVRRLPWVPPKLNSGAEMSEFPPLVLSSWSGLAVFVLPGLFVVRIMRRRRWSLAEWMLLPVIVGLLLLTFRLLVEHQFFQRFDRPALHVLHQAAIGSTLSVFPALLLVAAMRRRWLHVVGLLALSVFISGAAAAVILAVGQSELAAEERFSTEGWYVIWLWGAYLTGWLVLAVLLVRRLIILVRQRSARQPG